MHFTLIQTLFHHGSINMSAVSYLEFRLFRLVQVAGDMEDPHVLPWAHHMPKTEKQLSSFFQTTY